MLWGKLEHDEEEQLSHDAKEEGQPAGNHGSNGDTGHSVLRHEEALDDELRDIVQQVSRQPKGSHF